MRHSHVKRRFSFGLSRKREAGVAYGIILFFFASAIFISASTKCAHDSQPHVVVLPEKTGSRAADVIGWLTGQRPHAATLPGGTIVVFQPADAKDECLIVHETVHVEDQQSMGEVAWIVEYTHQYQECERHNSSENCLRTIDLEKHAYEAQHECERKRH